MQALEHQDVVRLAQEIDRCSQKVTPSWTTNQSRSNLQRVPSRTFAAVSSYVTPSYRCVTDMPGNPEVQRFLVLIPPLNESSVQRAGADKLHPPSDLHAQSSPIPDQS